MKIKYETVYNSADKFPVTNNINKRKSSGEAEKKSITGHLKMYYIS